MSDSSRIEALESRIAFLEHSLDEVNRALLALEKTCARQELSLERLTTRLTELAAQPATADREPPPPHY